jgi:hypothetical protein
MEINSSFDNISALFQPPSDIESGAQNSRVFTGCRVFTKQRSTSAWHNNRNINHRIYAVGLAMQRKWGGLVVI